MFKQDIEDALKLTREKARSLILEIFERIKKWYTLTKKSIKLMFHNQVKRKKVISKQDLVRVLNKVVRPLLLSDSHIDAIISVIGN